MLPVASPKHGDGAYYPRGERQVGLATAYADPMAASMFSGGGYPDMHTADPRQQQQQQQSGMDLESIKNQKILEFRKALEHDLEQKRLQAQKELEDVERRQWQQYMEFQQALQGETRQYIAQSPMSSSMDQLRMSSPSPQQQQQHRAMAGPASPMHPSQNVAAAYNAMHQQQFTHHRQQLPQHHSQHQHPSMARAASPPMRSANGASTVASSISQHSLGFGSQSTIHQYNSNTMPSQNPLRPNTPYHQHNQQPSPLNTTRTHGIGYSSNPTMMTPPSIPVPVVTTPGSMWGGRPPHANIFTFDNVGNDQLPNTGANATSFQDPNSYYLAAPTEEDRIRTDTIWEATSPRQDQVVAERGTLHDALPATGALAVRHHQFTQADELEKEYARLTGKEGNREATLRNIKKLQEQRRKKLENLTARVVENRKRFAREVGKSDRPREISFVDSREDHNTKDTKRGTTREEKKEYDNGLHSIREERAGDIKTSKAGKGGQESSTGDEDYSNERDVSSREDLDSGEKRNKHQNRDSKGSSRIKRQNQEISSRVSSPRMETSTQQEKKGEDKANHFVEKLREKRTQANSTGNDYGIEPTYSRQDVLSALETGQKKITLPTRDPKLARKNRKLFSQRLFEKSKLGSKPVATKIATKRSTCSNPSEVNTKSDKPTNAGTLSSRELDLNQKYTDNTGIDADEETQRRNGRASGNRGTASTIMSDLSESAYGGFNGNGEKVVESADESGEESRSGSPDEQSETTSMFEEDAEYLISGTAGTAPDDDGDAFDEDYSTRTPAREEVAASGSKVSKSNSRKSNIKVRDYLATDSRAEGFEIEEGFDLNSIYSGRSRYSKQANTEETADEAEQRHETLKELEQKLDPKDFRKMVPELLEFTEENGWDIKKVMRHFKQMLPNVAKGILKSSPPASQRQNSASAATTPRAGSNVGIKSRAVHQQVESREPPPQASRSPPASRPVSPNVHQISPRHPPGRPISPKISEKDQPAGPPAPTTAVTAEERGWRSRVRAGTQLRSSRGGPDQSSIDMSDVRTSLKSLSHSRRTRRGSSRRGAYTPDLQSLEER